MNRIFNNLSDNYFLPSGGYYSFSKNTGSLTLERYRRGRMGETVSMNLSMHITTSFTLYISKGEAKRGFGDRHGRTVSLSRNH
jgi:hypothetical protein